MGKKKLSSKVGHIGARLSMKKDRWEIVYYQTDPADGVRKRHRETGDLNRIRDLRERKKQALALVAKINTLLPDGYPYVSSQQIEVRKAMPTLLQAIEQAISIKLKTDREETAKDYRSIGGVLIRWVEAVGASEWPVGDFSRRHALEFMDHVATRKTRDGAPIRNRTWNNYKTKTSTIFGELVHREVIAENPFKGITAKPVTGKTRRKCTPEERAHIAAYLWQHDFYIFLFVTLKYYCLLRGTELRRLRARDFDFSRGIITLSAENSKNRRDRHPTMTVYVREVLQDERFLKIPGNYLVFGTGGQPSPSEAFGRSFARNRLKKCLEALQRQGKIGDVEGLSPYSFKDTGITDWLQLLPLTSVMQQAGHTNPSTTMIYNQPDLVNEGFASIKTKITEI
jgi:integrase